MSYHSDSEFYYPERDKENENATTTTTRNDDNISQDIQEFIEDQRPETTKKKTDYDIGIWKKLCSSNNENREIEEIPAVEMNVLLCRFFMNVKKKNGGEYEPSSLTSMHRSIQRYLNNKNSPLNLFKDQEFNKSREVLVAKKRQLVEIHAKGNRPQAARIMTEAEEDLLFEKGQFGDHNLEVHQQIIYIQLEPGTIGSGVAGIVRVYNNGQWGTVCHDAFDMNDAKVACRQLGFAKAVGYWYWGRGSGKVWLNGMQCSGSETSLQTCNHYGWGNHGSGCDSHKYDVGVVYCHWY
ncbi:hypothetical protein QZH41_020515 [Actinostola sp. cb2023]|nr:hypothetical protein QZH41_020515 [Actinostola sp. cb2023]